MKDFIIIQDPKPELHLTPSCRFILTFVSFQDYKLEEDPALFHSTKTGRGPLSPEWKVPDVVVAAEVQ